MSNKMTKTLMIAATILLLGCNDKGVEPTKELHAVQITATKVSQGVAVEQNARTSVRFLQTNGATPTSLTGAAPFLGDRAADGSIAWKGTAPQYSQLDENAHFVAYHPSVTETAGIKVDWVVDGKTDIVLSKPWDAGKHSAPKTGAESGETPLTFDYILAQLAVVFQAEAGADYDRIKNQYGKITGIKLSQTLPTATYTYATNKVTFSGTKSDVALLQSNNQTAFEAIDIPASTNEQINAAGLFAPSTGAFTLILTTENFSEIPVAVQLTDKGVNKSFDAGFKHTITITFETKQAEVAVSDCSIVDWGTNHNAAGEVNI